VSIRLYSHGGCGTEYFQHALEDRHIAQTIGKQRDRHKRNPSGLGSKRVIYLYGDPRNTILSFYRRQFGDGPIHCNNLGIKYDQFFPKTIQCYICQDYDAFGLEEHFDNWTALRDRPNTLLVQYELLENDDYLKRIEEFIGCGMRKVAFKKRNSDWKDFPQLTTIHSSLLEKIEKINGGLSPQFPKL
jgi:hypothetical protein